MLLIVFIQALAMLPLTGIDGQEVVFGPLSLISKCKQGLISGTDKFTFTGTVGRNYSALLLSRWETVLKIQISVFSSQFKKMCNLYIGTGGFYCEPFLTDECYCTHINTTTGSAHIVVNFGADQNKSEGVIRAHWRNDNGSVIYSKNTITLPAIYDAKAAHLSLSVFGLHGNLASPGSCNFSLTLNKSNHLILCCSNTATPCYPRISFRGDSVRSNACVSYPTSPLTSDGVTGDLVLSYSLCGQDEYIPEGNCTLTLTPDVYTTTTTGTTATDVHTTTTTGTTATATSTITSASKAPVTTTPRTTTLPFFLTTDLRNDQADQKNLLTTFWPWLVIFGLGFVVVLVCVVWDVVSNGTSKNKPTVESYTAVNEGEIIEKNEESKEVHEAIDSDTPDEKDINSRMSETEV